MNATKRNDEDAPGSVHDLRVVALLLDLVERHGKARAAEILGVNYHTLSAPTIAAHFPHAYGTPRVVRCAGNSSGYLSQILNGLRGSFAGSSEASARRPVPKGEVGGAGRSHRGEGCGLAQGREEGDRRARWRRSE